MSLFRLQKYSYIFIKRLFKMLICRIVVFIMVHELPPAVKQMIGILNQFMGNVSLSKKISSKIKKERLSVSIHLFENVL